MSSALVPAVIVGGVAYVATRPKGPPAQPTSHPGYGPGAYPGQPTVGAGNAPGVLAVSAQNPIPPGYRGKVQFSPSATAAILGMRTGSAAPRPQTVWNYGNDQNLDPSLKAKFDEIEAAAQKAYNDANEVAKAKAADALNKELKLDPPLTGHEDWKTVSAVVGGATGGAIGGAIGGPLGAKLGALAGAYLGVKLEELIEKNLDEIKEWISDKWGDVKEFAEDVYDEVSGWVPW